MLGAGGLAASSQKGEFEAATPLSPAVSINKANPTVPSATPQPFPAHPGGSAISCYAWDDNYLPSKGGKTGLTTDDAIRHRLASTLISSTARQREPGGASCHLPRASKTFAAPCALTHLRLTYLALALLGLLLGSRLCTPPFSWLFLGFFLPQTPNPAIAHHARLSFFDLFPAR